MFRHKKLVNLIAEIFGFPRNYDHGSVEVEYNCPHCDKGGNKFNLVVNTDIRIFHCWACDYRGKVERIFYDYGSDRQKTSYRLLKKNKGLFNDEKKESVVELTGFRSMKFEWKDSLSYYAAVRYLRTRNIDFNLIDKWDICYAETGKYKDRIIVPSKNLDGRVDYFVARDIFDTQKMKYNNPPIDKAGIIFGEKFIDWKKPLFLTEGVFDAMAMYNAVPILGVNIKVNKKLLRMILKNKTRVILGFDKDATKEESTVAKYLKNFGIDVYIIEHNCYNDLAEVFEKDGKSGIIELIQNSKPYDELEMAVADLRGG